MVKLNDLPLVIEHFILDDKLGLESYELHYKKMKKCIKEINKINHSYMYDIERECNETLVLKFGTETYYYIHDSGDDEIETSYVNADVFLKYYLFEKNRLTQYTNIN